MTTPVLEAGEVHVWQFELERDQDETARLRELLSSDERARGERLGARGREFVICRGIVRRVLAVYLGIAPERLPLRTARGGKPQLAPGSGLERLRFNLAHSSGRALLAVSRDREVGVDLERVAPERAIGTIAEQLFSLRESSILQALPPSRRLATFFAWWTRKEALLKAVGTGLAVPLAEVEVADGPRELRLADRAGQPRRWVVRDLPVGPGFAAALAAEGNVSAVRKEAGAA